jgi:hypothetical protein
MRGFGMLRPAAVSGPAEIRAVATAEGQFKRHIDHARPEILTN